MLYPADDVAKEAFEQIVHAARGGALGINREIGQDGQVRYALVVSAGCFPFAAGYLWPLKPYDSSQPVPLQQEVLWDTGKMGFPMDNGYKGILTRNYPFDEPDHKRNHRVASLGDGISIVLPLLPLERTPRAG